jgi:hypothetical protein
MDFNHEIREQKNPLATNALSPRRGDKCRRGRIIWEFPELSLLWARLESAICSLSFFISGMFNMAYA